MQGAKTVYIENAAADLEAGKVDYVIWSYTEILRNDKLHGAAVPSELGGYVTQAIGIPVAAKRAADAQAFINFIKGPEAAAILKRWGMEQIPAGRN
jgi:ABC-type molybdate transport system substrate-binding protein